MDAKLEHQRRLTMDKQPRTLEALFRAVLARGDDGALCESLKPLSRKLTDGWFPACAPAPLAGTGAEPRTAGRGHVKNFLDRARDSL